MEWASVADSLTMIEIMSMLLHVARLLFALLALLGVALHFTIRDSVPVLFTAFYALPLPACAGLLLGAGILGIPRVGWIAACFLGAIAVTGIWLTETYGTHPPGAGDVRIATWNIARPHHPLPALIDLVQREELDFVALVESGTMNAEIAREYERVLPGYRCTILPGGMACLSRDPIDATAWHALHGGGQANVVSTKLGNAQMRILILDLSADVFQVRAGAFAAVETLAGREPRTILMGDFNTPLESVYCDDLRRTFLNAMDAGQGFRETWFFGLPLLSLDQIWTSRDLPPVTSRRVFTLASDHAPVIAELRIAPIPGDTEWDPPHSSR